MPIFTIPFLILSLVTAQSGDFTIITGKVVDVSSGDLITVKVGREHIRVRLAEIDCPEPAQPFGNEARKFIHKLAFNKKVTLKYEMIDLYNRVIADVVLQGGLNLNEALMEEGLAWHYKVNHPVNPKLIRLEYRAWSLHMGLWMDPEPVAPWIYRRENILLDPPGGPAEVDYDQILNYGLLGDKNTRIYQWPACSNYGKINPANSVVFSSKLEAEAMGFHQDKHCPKKPSEKENIQSKAPR